MFLFPPTIILRHRKENLKKCSLRGIEGREDILFISYPTQTLPDLSNYILLTLDAPPLTKEEAHLGLFLLDATWKKASIMQNAIAPQANPLLKRSLPKDFITAYPRRQEDCLDPQRGLASIEALFIAYHLLGRKTEGLLEKYYWKQEFLEKNLVGWQMSGHSL